MSEPVVIDTIAGLERELKPYRERGQRIGLVPTMGALHAGHRTLIELARQQCPVVVVSIFVNPTQFNQAADFEKYPRTLDVDVEVCHQAGASIIFTPSAGEMYPGAQYTTVEVQTLGDHLCGAFRPGHFRGVATVVTKLLNIVRPERAYFGEKDAQQLAIIERMVADLNLPVEIVPVPTVREADGLAMSSRNTRLNAEARAAAPAVFRALQMVEAQLVGGCQDAEAAKSGALAMLAGIRPEARVEYLEIVERTTLTPVVEVAGPVLIAIAVWLGDVRLIDNIRVG